MKRMLPALALASAIISAPALAQNTVTLYGIVDTGVEFITHASPTGGSLARMPVIGGGDVPSRWGIKGTEDLGGGMHAIFTLESGISLSNGTLQQSNRLFGRQAFVGFDTPWGQLTFGRHYSMQTLGMVDSNIMGPSGIGGLGSLDAQLLADRFDNDVSYIGTYRGLTVGATYSFGRDTQAAGNCPGQIAGDFLACRGLSAMVKYDTNSWGVVGTYEELRGGPGAAPIGTVPGVTGIAFTKPADTDRRYQLGAHVYIGPVKVGAGWVHRQLDAAQSLRTDIEWLGASVPYGYWIFDSQISHISNKTQDANATQGVVRANYFLSKRTALYGLVGYLKNSGKGAVYSVSAGTAVPASPAPGVGQLGLEVGIRHSF